MLEAGARTHRPERELEGKLPPLSLSLFGSIVVKKAMVVVIVVFF
jgi:hypothetical protein